MAKKSKKQTKTFGVSIKTRISGKPREYIFTIPEKNIRSLLSTAKKFEKIGRQSIKQHAGLARKDISKIKSELLKDKNISKATKTAKSKLKKLRKIFRLS